MTYKTREYERKRPACPVCGMSISVQIRDGGYYCYACSRPIDPDEVNE